MRSASNKVARPARQRMKRTVSLKHNAWIFLYGLEYIGDHFFVDRAVHSILQRCLAHFNPSRMKRNVAVLRRRHQQHILKVLKRRLFAQLVQECFIQIAVILQAELQQTAGLKQNRNLNI